MTNYNMEEQPVAWLIGYLSGTFYNGNPITEQDKEAFTALAKKVANIDYTKEV